MALTREEREQFLAEPHIAALSVEAEPGRAPLTVPIWYQYAPGGDIWIMTGLDTRKNRLIQAAGYSGDRAHGWNRLVRGGTEARDRTSVRVAAVSCSRSREEAGQW